MGPLLDCSVRKAVLGTQPWKQCRIVVPFDSLCIKDVVLHVPRPTTQVGATVGRQTVRLRFGSGPMRETGGRSIGQPHLGGPNVVATATDTRAGPDCNPNPNLNFDYLKPGPELSHTPYPW